MTAFSIATTNLDLVLQTPEEVLAWVAALPPEVFAQVSPDWIARVKQTTPGDPWALSYTVIERATGTAVGNCAFKGPPDSSGMVEVAYGIDEAQRCRGFATEATKGLIDFAKASGQVLLVRAHTMPDDNASIRVLTKCGFQLIGEVMDPEDGLVCRWELP
ncbi:GNAT family N-acetyltransferase [Anatilimnocola floriformis]|uniref:GNAT family N-acetyltransferase n=1 Tax=Anatilimnocola floriformis TaxID=2948575 RepID=UPI0020C48858|nr:GNAT family N-acetyltransferase [Anatilimnocola floriformis]